MAKHRRSRTASGRFVKRRATRKTRSVRALRVQQNPRRSRRTWRRAVSHTKRVARRTYRHVARYVSRRRAHKNPSMGGFLANPAVKYALWAGGGALAGEALEASQWAADARGKATWIPTWLPNSVIGGVLVLAVAVLFRKKLPVAVRNGLLAGGVGMALPAAFKATREAVTVKRITAAASSRRQLAGTNVRYLPSPASPSRISQAALSGAANLI